MCVRQSRKSSHAHPHAEVLAFRIGSADVCRIGFAFDPRLADANALTGTIAALGAFGSFAIQFHKHGVIDVGAESAFNSLQVGPVTIRSKLYAMGESRGEIVH